VCNCAKQAASPQSPSTYTSPTALRFSSSEVLTRTWRSADGHDLMLLDYSVMKFTNRSDLVLAKYGHRDLGTTNCLDFYVKYPVLPPDSNTLFLVSHDSEPGKVTAIAVTTEHGRVFIFINRELVSGNTNSATKIAYAYEYDTNGILLRADWERISQGQ
jgi:hypothetical protein